jgi:hypothetical protein
MTQRKIFWIWANAGIHDIDLFKERGRYVVLYKGILYATRIKSLGMTTAEFWMDIAKAVYRRESLI